MWRLSSTRFILRQAVSYTHLDVYKRQAWNEGRLTQSEAGMLLGVGERSFRRYLVRYEDDGLDGLIDRRLEQMGHHRAPVDEVMAPVSYTHLDVYKRQLRVSPGGRNLQAVVLLHSRHVNFPLWKVCIFRSGKPKSEC